MITIDGENFYSRFTQVNDGKYYSSSNDKQWFCDFMRESTPSWGNTTYGSEWVSRACPSAKNSSMRSDFKFRISYYLGLTDDEFVDLKNKVIDGSGHIYVKGDYIIVQSELFMADVRHGYVKEAAAKMSAAIKAWLYPPKEPKIDESMVAMYEEFVEVKHVDTEVTIRDAKQQADFRKRIAVLYHLECCVSGAPLIACEAVHLKPFAEDGGYDNDNGLLLRSDIHKLFDRGHMAIDPVDGYRIHFSPEVRDHYKGLSEYLAVGKVLPNWDELMKKFDTFKKRWSDQ
ncbi:HNH endonuclease [Citrobacter sp.]|uniref:HNH endonuclease n=1 Tax=Citrobacter sp. TaxID=1896336 RepID=UPI002FCADCA7